MNEPKITWYISEVTPAVTRKAIALQSAIRAACEIAPEDTNFMVNYTYYLAATRRLDVPERARQSVHDLAAFVAKWETLDPAEVWCFHQDNLSHILRRAWDEAFDAAQELFDPDPAELPDAALNPEQKAEAAQPGSPLTSRGANSVSNS